MKRHLAIDMGSESGRAVVGYLENGRLHMEEIHRFRTQFMQVRDKSYRNMYRINEEVQAALKIYAEKYGPELDSIGCDSWGGDFVILNRKGEIVKLPVSYREVDLSNDVASIIEEKFGERKLYDRNGCQRLPQDPLKQMLRLRLAEDPSLDDPHGMLFVADIIHYMLGARPCCERSMPTFSRMFNWFEDDWDYELLEALDIPKGICSEVVSPGETIGYVSEEILEQCGLKGPVRIIAAGTHDTACAVVAVPDQGKDWAFVSSGTWSLMGIETEKPVISDRAYELNLHNSTIPLRTNMFKRNVTGTWIINQCKEAWGKYTYPEIVDMAEQAPDTEFSIDVNATEFYAPKNMPKAVAESIERDYGVKVDPNDVGTIARAVFTGMVFKYKYYLENLLECAGRKISKMYIVGGGSKNRIINQFAANACGYPVYTGVYEASSVGNLLVQMYGCGELEDKNAMRKVSMDTFPQKVFEPQDKEAWDRKFQIYLEKTSKKNLW